MPTIQELAAQMNAALIHDTRNDGTEFVKLRDGSPEWMTDVIREAHGDSFPDDTIYRFIEKAIDAIENSDDAEDAIREIEDGFQLLGFTQSLHIQEIADDVLRALNAVLADMEDEELEEEDE